jgi:preprotein translocase subunit SecA
LPGGRVTQENPRAFYAERQHLEAGPLDTWAIGLLGHLRDALPQAAWRGSSAVQRAGRLAEAVAALDDAALRSQLRDGARRATAGLAPLARALALVREAAQRSLGMRPYDTQLLGASLLLRGKLAEMQTGEGKTLTAGLGAALAACAGLPVHVITVNDYLAERDAAKMRPLLAFLGASVGVVLTGMTPDERRRAYACDVTYCTGKELVFDYLKDKLACAGGPSRLALRLGDWLAGRPRAATLLRGLHFAIVDEADSIFIDEARTPLILSALAEGDSPPGPALAALALARSLQPGVHFQLRAAAREIQLTPEGSARVAAQALSLGAEGQVRVAREHVVTQALRALHLFHRDQHYVVKDDKAQIVDEQTGRTLPGRQWEGGLQQLVEAKEGVALSPPVHTLARITYQRFFHRYLRLSGMTGTAREAGAELWRVYGLHTVTVPTHRPSQRKLLPALALPDDAAKWRAVCAAVQQQRAAGRPVLVGTRSVAASERLSHELTALGVPHQVLNALQDADEAAVVARAGVAGRVTVATNMAGRGTDIELGPGVADAGGLHVILTEFHDSPRVDRQLFGRAARQGDAGSAQAIVSVNDELLAHHGAPWRHAVPRLPPALHALAVGLLRRRGQRATETQHARQRQAALRSDREIETLLSFSGRN